MMLEIEPITNISLAALTLAARKSEPSYGSHHRVPQPSHVSNRER